MKHKIVMVMLSLALIVGLALAGCMPAAPVTEEPEYPTRPITYVVGYKPGGGDDIFARIFTPYLQKYLGVDVLVVNVPGAGGLVQLERVMEAYPPDGYSISHFAISGTLMSGTGVAGPVIIDPSQTRIIGGLTVEGYVLGARADTYQTLEDFVEDCRKRPGEVKVGLASVAGAPAFIVYAFRDDVGLDFETIPFGSGAVFFKEIVAGRITAGGMHYAGWMPYLGEDVDMDMRLNILAVFGEERFPPAPDVPTFKELGYDIAAFQSFFTAIVRPDTPEEIVKILEEAYYKVGNDPDFLREIAEIGGRHGMRYMPPDEVMQTSQDAFDLAERMIEAGVVPAA